MAKESRSLVEFVEEENYMFPFEEFQDDVRDWLIESGIANEYIKIKVLLFNNPAVIYRGTEDWRKKVIYDIIWALLVFFCFIFFVIDLLSALDVILPKQFLPVALQYLRRDGGLSISRDAFRQKWGIAVPGDPSQTVILIFLITKRWKKLNFNFLSQKPSQTGPYLIFEPSLSFIISFIWFYDSNYLKH